MQKLPNVIRRLSTHMQSSHNCRDQVKPSLSKHLVKVRWEQCSRMTLGTWGLKALINTLNGKQATQLRQLFSQGTKGVEVVAVSALCPTLACEPAKGNWAPSSGSLHCSLVSAGASEDCRGRRQQILRKPMISQLLISPGERFTPSLLSCHLREQHSLGSGSDSHPPTTLCSFPSSPKHCCYKRKCKDGTIKGYSTRSKKERQKQKSTKHPTLANFMHHRRC